MQINKNKILKKLLTCFTKKRICDKNMSENGKQEEIDILAEEAKAVTLELLPRKSREIYEKTFNGFLLWCTQKNIADRQINENVLLVYFKEESQKFCPSTLWSHYSMIRSVMVLKHGIDIKQYKLLYAFLKRQNENYKPKKSKVLERKEIVQFFQQAPDEEFLMIKVALLMGLGGDCRREELSNLTLDNIEDVGSALLVSVNNTKTKVDRTFAIVNNDEESLDFLDMYRRYIALRPSHVQHRRLFLKYKNGKCVNQVVGKITLGFLPRKIAEFLKLEDPADYTGHCFRRSSATLAANSGTDMTNLKRLGGWKSSTTAESYIENGRKTKLNIAKNVLVGESFASASGASQSSPPTSASMSTSSYPSKKVKLEETLPANPVVINVPATDGNIQQNQLLTLKIDINVNVNK